MKTGSTVIVTGAAGFIGSRTCLQLLRNGFRVVGIDNLNDYYAPDLKKHRLSELLSIPNFEFHLCDIENSASVTDLFSRTKPKCVINLAARAGVRASMENPHVYYTTNVMGSLNLLEAMREANVKKYVLASTSSLYAGQPMPFDEALPVNTPISPYAASKKAAEVMAYTWHALYGFDVSIVRYFTVYGPAGRPDMAIFRFIYWIDHGTPIQLFGDGSQARDFTYVDDIAAGTVAAAKDVGFEIMNLGGGNQPVSISEVISILEELLGKTATIHHKAFHQADVPATWANIDKAERILSWKPKIGLREGLKLCVDWYRANQALSINVMQS